MTIHRTQATWNTFEGWQLMLVDRLSPSPSPWYSSRLMLTVCVWLYTLLSVATSSVSFRPFANGSTLVGTLLCPPSTELDCSSATVTPAVPATKTRTVVRTVEVVHQMQTQHMRKNTWITHKAHNTPTNLLVAVHWTSSAQVLAFWDNCML